MVKETETVSQYNLCWLIDDDDDDDDDDWKKFEPERVSLPNEILFLQTPFLASFRKKRFS